MAWLTGDKVRREGGTPGKLGLQHAQRRHVIDVVPHRQHVHGQAELIGAGACLLRHALGAPGYVLEQPAVWLLRAEQVVATVGGGAEHDSLAGLCQDASGLHQQRRGQGGAVRIENDRAAMAKRQKLRDRRMQTVAEARMRGLDQPDLARQDLLEERS